MATHRSPETAFRTTSLPSGETVPVLGQGTWGLAEHPGRRASEISALQMGIDLGMTLIDTAEMYAGGAAEALVAEAIEGQRAGVFLVSKVLPNHPTRRGTIAACEGSLRRLHTDRLDLYLLHSPIEQGRLLGQQVLRRVARRQTATPAQIALAWVLRLDGVIAIPKTSSIDHVRENRGALEISLTPADLAELDAAFPPPNRPTPLETL